MGSMRNPVGPLPSSIYWRRRAVVLCLLALVVALVAWALNSGGGGGGKGSGAPNGSHTPVATITAGPAPSGTHIGGRPGGRDTAPSGDGSSNGGTGAGGSSSAGTSGSGGSAGAGNGGDSSGSSAGAGGSTAGAQGSSSGGMGGSEGTAGSGSGGTSATGGQVPVGSSLPDCSAGAVSLSLTSAQNSYSPDQTPAFKLTASNSGAVSCKLDFGPRSAVFTVSKTGQSTHVWASDDCPATGSYLLQVPAHGATAFTLRWNGKNSSPHCASPKGQQAQPGTYLVQAKLPGYGVQQTSFVLSSY